MKINRDNYGAFFLDYWENNLDEQGRTELAGFLEKYPELQDEFFDFQQLSEASLPKDKQIVFRQKQVLKKTEVTSTGNIHQDNYETYIIASLEGDLGEEEKKQFEAFCEINPAVSREIEYFERTFLKPAANIAFPYKPGLKRGLMIRMMPFGRIAAAAAVIIFLAVSAVYFFNRSDSELSNSELVFDQPEPPASIGSIDETSRVIDGQQMDIEPQMLARSESQQIIPVNPAKKFSAPEQKEADAGQLSAGYIEMPVIPRIAQQQPMLAMQVTSVDKIQMQPRSEVSSVFDYMLIRDAMVREDADDEKGKSLAGKVLANLFNKALGLENATEDNGGTLLAEVTERGRERLSEVSERVPFFKRVEESGQLKTIFGLNENFSVKKTSTIHPQRNQQGKDQVR